MQQNENKQNKWSRGEKIALLSIIITILLSLLQYLPYLNSKIMLLAFKHAIPLHILNLLITLTLFVILSLILSLLCIFKKNKLLKPLGIYKTPLINETTLPPKKDMGKILLAMCQSDNFTPNDMENESNLSTAKIKSYLSILVGNGYAEYTGYYPTAMGGISYKTYTITLKGSEFLNKHKFL